VFGQSLRQIPRSWRLISIVTLLVWIVSLFISYNTVPIYRASATFLVFPNASLTSSRDVVTSLDTLDRKTVSSTYADIMSSTRVYGEAVQKLKLNPKSLVGYTHTTLVQENSNVLELDIEGSDPEMATLLANNIGQTGINYIKGIYQVFDISFLDQAVRPASPISPQPIRDGAVAAGIGLLLGLVIVMIKEQLRLPLEALRERSIRDKISGAYTQRHFHRLLDQALVRHPEEPVSLAVIELNGLQDLVDGLPEAVLSGLMHQVTVTLHDQLRGHDAVGRWGKIGFSLLLPATPELPAARTIERICRVLVDPVQVEGLDEPVSLSPHAGLACRGPNEMTLELIHRVEEVLEIARGTENCVFYPGKNEREG
jgi:capsular polysaccharide biosynthesis protein